MEVRIIRYKLEYFIEWCKENKSEFEIVNTETRKKGDKYVRYVLIREISSNIEKWVMWSTFKKSKVFNIKKNNRFDYSKENIQKELNNKFGYIRFEDNYSNIKNKHRFYCSIHKEYFYSLIDVVLKSKFGCKRCSIERGNIYRLSNEDFIKKLNDIEDYNSSYKVLEEYKNNNTTKIKFLHKKCGNIFYMAPNNFLNGQRCPFCKGERASQKLSKSDFDFKKEIIDKYGEKYIFLSKYKNQNTKIKVKFKKCGHIADVLPSSMQRGYGCKVCSSIKLGLKKRKKHEDFLLEVEVKYPNQFEILTPYKNRNSEIKVRHKICGSEFLTTPSNLINSGSCKMCSMSSFESVVYEFLNRKNIFFIYQKYFDKCKNKNKLPFDFYVPSKNLLIEVDGRFHYEEILGNDLKNRKYIDSLKNRFCFFYDFKLVRIPYWKISKIEDILNTFFSL